MAFYYKIPIQLQPIRTYIDTKKETIIILQLQANNNVTTKKYWFEFFSGINKEGQYVFLTTDTLQF